MIEQRERAVIMPVVLLKEGTHEEAIAAAATAVLRAYRSAAPGDPVWEAWLADDEGKTVRRASQKDFEKIAALGAHLGSSAAGDARALAFPPVPYEAMPNRIRRLQVGGTDLPRAERVPASGSPFVYLNGGLRMSTGKSCAQAAHALLAWWRSLNEQERAAAVTEDVWVVELDSKSFARVAELLANPSQLIHDAGHTEIEPGSATAFVLPH